MKLIGNNLNGRYVRDLVGQASGSDLTQIDLAVAYSQTMDAIFELADSKGVPLSLYTLVDGQGFPHTDIVRKFVQGKRLAWRLFLTKDFYHPKIMWFRGVGAYIGSANLSNRAWTSNAECGIWLAQDELSELGWVDELSAIFSAIRARCREAKEEDLVTLEKLDRSRSKLSVAEKEFQNEVNQALSNIPGGQSPHDKAKTDQAGSAKFEFLKEWNAGSTILRKITKALADNKDRWPKWVSQEVHPAIVQDQVTEWWWHNEFRRSGESAKLLEEAHGRNAKDPDAMVAYLIKQWTKFDGTGGNWGFYLNESPRELRTLLSPLELKKLDEERLYKILHLCHSAREHARQISKRRLGLAADENKTVEERSRLFSQFLLSNPSEGGRSIGEVLEFVLWGDKAGSKLDGAERIWAATHEDEWRIPHMGRHILGELIGYARPDDYPPRNQRVSKTLHALGFAGIEYK